MDATAAPLVRSSGNSGNLLSKRWLQCALIIIGLVVVVVTNLPWNLDEYDQAKQAYTSYEMVHQGHWFYQHTPRGRLATKPPLVGWISAGSYEVSRSWVLAWGLPSLLSTIAIAALLIRNTKAVFGSALALVAGCAFAFNLLTPRLATLVRTDMPLALVVFTVGCLIWRHLESRRSWDRRERWIIFALLAAGTLIKGPIVYAFLLPGLLLFQFFRKRSDPHNEWPGWWPWIASLGVFLLWVVFGVRFLPGFYDQVVGHEFLGRFGGTEHQSKPIYFYLPHLLVRDFPWSVLILMLTWLLWRRSRAPAERQISPGLIWLACWVVGALLLMSFIPSKRVDRIYPLIPSLALLLAALIGSFGEKVRHTILRVPVRAAVLVAVLLAVGYSSLKVIRAFHQHDNALVEFGQAVRKQAVQKHWRYDVVYGGDEGMLLYLDKNFFTDPAAATSNWNSGRVSALVISAEAHQTSPLALHPAPKVALESEGTSKSRYLLLTRD